MTVTVQASRVSRPGASPAPRADLGRLLTPRGIAVVGASENAQSIGGMPMKYLTELGYSGQVYPVNPKRTEIRGLKCHRSVLEVPDPCDVALIGVAAAQVSQVIRECGERKIPFAIILSAGFREAGPEGEKLETELKQVIAETGVRVVGPNCLGILNVPARIHNGFGAGMDELHYRPGPIAIVTQSGGYGFTMIKAAHRAGANFQYMVSIGNSVDLTLLDFIEYFLECEEVGVVSAFIEGVSDGRRLVALGKRALELKKPIIVWKAGNTEAGSRAAASHTASLAASYSLYQAAFRSGGYIEIREYDDLVDISRAFASGILPEGNRIGIVSGSGGAGVVGADRCEEAGLTLPALQQSTVDALKATLPGFAAVGNPADISGQRSKDGRSASNRAAALVIQDPNIDLVIVRSRQTTASSAHAEDAIDIRNAANKPMMVAMGSDEDLESRVTLDAAKFPWHLTIGRAVVAAKALVEFAEKRRKHLAHPTMALRKLAPQPLSFPAGSTTLSERDSKDILARYGVPVTRDMLFSLKDVEALITPPMEFPVAVKINSPDIAHKTEAGAVRLGISSLDGLKQAARDVAASARAYCPGARIDGVLVQEMATGTEVIVGAINDACFGPTVLFGLGGIFTEVLKDITYQFAPFDRRTARAMIDEIKGAKLLKGYRGAPPPDLDALADILVNVSLLISDHADKISSIDINPVFVRAGSIKAADGLIVLHDAGQPNPQREARVS